VTHGFSGENRSFGQSTLDEEGVPLSEQEPLKIGRHCVMVCMVKVRNEQDWEERESKEVSSRCSVHVQGAASRVDLTRKVVWSVYQDRTTLYRT
jgi:hypothetical protein